MNPDSGRSAIIKEVIGFTIKKKKIEEHKPWRKTPYQVAGCFDPTAI